MSVEIAAFVVVHAANTRTRDPGSLVPAAAAVAIDIRGGAVPLFRKKSGDGQPKLPKPRKIPRGTFYPDPLNRFDVRLMISISMSQADWGEDVQVGGNAYRDPLPPAFTVSWVDDLQMMESRARNKLVRGTPGEGMKSLRSATRYYDDKVTTLLEVFAPHLPPDERPEFDRMMAATMIISGREYLDKMAASVSYRDMFDNAIVPTDDPRRHIAWFWDIDDYFQLTIFHDDLIFRGGQLILKNRGFMERGFLGPPLPA